MATSCPARARSKKARTVIAGSVTTEQAHQHRRGATAEGVGEATASAVDLARAGLAAELRDDLRDLRGARRADRMALGLQAARRVDGDLTAEARATLFGGAATGARLEEAEPLGGDDLGDREAVVQLDDVPVAGAEAGLTIRRGGGALRGRNSRQVALVAEQHPVRRGRGSEHPDGLAVAPRDLFGGQHERRAAVAERAAVEELERVGDVGRL